MRTAGEFKGWRGAGGRFVLSVPRKCSGVAVAA